MGSRSRPRVGDGRAAACDLASRPVISRPLWSCKLASRQAMHTCALRGGGPGVNVRPPDAVNHLHPPRRCPPVCGCTVQAANSACLKLSARIDVLLMWLLGNGGVRGGGGCHWKVPPRPPTCREWTPQALWFPAAPNAANGQGQRPAVAVRRWACRHVLVGLGGRGGGGGG